MDDRMTRRNYYQMAHDGRWTKLIKDLERYSHGIDGVKVETIIASYGEIGTVVEE